MCINVCKFLYHIADAYCAKCPKYGVGRLARLTEETTPLGLLLSAEFFLLLLLPLLLLLLLLLHTRNRYGGGGLAQYFTASPLSHHITATAPLSNCPLFDFGYINDKPITLLHMPPPLHLHYLGAAGASTCITDKLFPLLLRRCTPPQHHSHHCHSITKPHVAPLCTTVTYSHHSIMTHTPWPYHSHHNSKSPLRITVVTFAHSPSHHRYIGHTIATHHKHITGTLQHREVTLL